MSRVAIKRPPNADAVEDQGEPVDYNIYLPQGNQNDPIVEYMEDEYTSVNLMEKARRDGKQYVYGQGMCVCIHMYTLVCVFWGLG